MSGSCSSGQVQEAAITKQNDPGYPEQLIRKCRMRRSPRLASAVFQWVYSTHIETRFHGYLINHFATPTTIVEKP